MFRSCIISDHFDVVRFDIPVDHVRFMEFIQLQDQRFEQIDYPLPGHSAAAVLRFFRQAAAIHEVHDDVSGPVFPEIIPHFYDVWAFNGCKPLGFFLKFIAAFAETVCFCLRRNRCHADRERRADTDTYGEIFLDGYLDFQRGIETQIGDAEPALPQDPAHQIFPGKDGPFRECIFRVLMLAVIMTAGRTDTLSGIKMRHAVEAIVQFRVSCAVHINARLIYWSQVLSNYKALIGKKIVCESVLS